MATGAHTIKLRVKATSPSKRVGRGNSSGKGTYSARGLKGQKARSGGRGGTARIGFKQHLLKVPKLRGFQSPHTKKETVTLETLNRIVKANDVVTPKYLNKKGVISNPSAGIKIVAKGTIEKPVTIQGCLASKQAVASIEKAGGKMMF